MRSSNERIIKTIDSCNIDQLLRLMLQFWSSLFRRRHHKVDECPIHAAPKSIGQVLHRSFVSRKLQCRQDDVSEMPFWVPGTFRGGWGGWWSETHTLGGLHAGIFVRFQTIVSHGLSSWAIVAEWKT